MRAYKTALFCLFIGFCFTALSAQEAEIEEKKKVDLDIDPKFYFSMDQDLILERYQSIGAKIEIEFDTGDNWSYKIELDAAIDAVETHKIWAKYKADDYKVKIGMYKNEILLEDKFSHEFNSFVDDNLIQSRMDLNGWYSSSSQGFEIYDDCNSARLLFQPTGREVQVGLGWYYPFAGEDSYLGLSAVYYNHTVHRLWVDDEGFTNDHNFLASAAIADLSGNLPFFYKLDITLGNNLIDPIGFLHYPSEGDTSLFLGSDFMIGYPLGDEDFLWTPAFNASIILQDLEYHEAWASYLRMGHQLAWDETFYIRLEGGVEIDTVYDTYEHENPTLVTSLEALWGISIQVRL